MSSTKGETDALTAPPVPTTSALPQTKKRCSFKLFSRRHNWSGDGQVDSVSFDPSSAKPFALDLTEPQKKTLGSPRGSKTNIHVPKTFNLVSRNHASFVATDKQLYLFESKAKYGTKLDGEKLKLNTFYPLEEGSHVTLSPNCRAHGTAFEFEVEGIKFDDAPVPSSSSSSAAAPVQSSSAKYDSEVSQGTSGEASPIVIDSDDEDEDGIEDPGEQSDLEVIDMGIAMFGNEDYEDDDDSRTVEQDEDEEDEDEDEEEEDEDEDEEDEDEEDEDDDLDANERDKAAPWPRNHDWNSDGDDSDEDNDDNIVEPPSLVGLPRTDPSTLVPTRVTAVPNPIQPLTADHPLSVARNTRDLLDEFHSAPNSISSTPSANPRLRLFQKPGNRFESPEDDFPLEEDIGESFEEAQVWPTGSFEQEPIENSFHQVSTGAAVVEKTAEVAAEKTIEVSVEKPAEAATEVSTEPSLIEELTEELAKAPTEQEPTAASTVQGAPVPVIVTPILEPAATSASKEPLVTYTVSQPQPTAAFDDVASIPRSRKRTREELEGEEDRDVETPLPKRSSGGRGIGRIFTAVAAGMLVGSIGTVTALASMST